MSQITVRQSLDGTPAFSPTMRGAVPDYKATTYNLAAQVLALNHALDEASGVEASLRSIIGSRDTTIRQQDSYIQQALGRKNIIRCVASHWTFAFLPRTLRGSITVELGR